MKIWFDMDGTIADLYGVAGWLESIIKGETKPYEMAKGIGSLATIARLLNKAQANGYRVGIISWTARDGKPAYNKAVETAKREWLHKHLPSVTWDEIKVLRKFVGILDCTHLSDIIQCFEAENGLEKKVTGPCYAGQYSF